MSITKRPFGVDIIGRPMTLYTLTNKRGASVSVLDYGAHLVSVIVPDKAGNMADVCLGFDDLATYEGTGNSYIGASIGRFGNRIGKAKFTLNGVEYTLFPNDGKNTLHGGREGFDKKWWKADTLESENEDAVVLTYIAHDGEEGYPGKLHVQITYAFDEDCKLSIRYLAQSDKDTVINLTNHSYFNLAGSGDVLSHTLQIFADTVTDVDDELIPNGKLLPVAGTPLDVNQPLMLSDALKRRKEAPLIDAVDGYDVNYVLNGTGYHECAVLRHAASGRVMRVYTEEPGIQVYSGQGLNIAGKNGVHYGAYAGIALETQHFPDSPNQPHFPTTTLKAGDTYQTQTAYAFGVE